jgi:hypothetical protein
MYLRRPLLVTGRPGTGKSSLALSIAWELQLGSVLSWAITSRSQLHQSLYRYDAVGRLQEANLRRLGQEGPPVTSAGPYITLGPLGTALVTPRTDRGRPAGSQRVRPGAGAARHRGTRHRAGRTMARILGPTGHRRDRAGVPRTGDLHRSDGHAREPTRRAGRRPARGCAAVGRDCVDRRSTSSSSVDCSIRYANASRDPEGIFTILIKWRQENLSVACRGRMH